MRPRRRRDESGHVDPFHKRRLAYESVLRAIGLAAAFAKVHRRNQEQIWRGKMPEPAVEHVAPFPANPAERDLAQRVEQAMRQATVQIADAVLPAVQFVGVTAGIKCVTVHTRETPAFQPEVREFLRLARAYVAQDHLAHWEKAITQIFRAAISPVVAHSRLDTRLYTAVPADGIHHTGKFVMKLLLSASEPQTRRVVLDGEPRPVYRAATNWGGGGIKWVSWKREHLGRLAIRDEYPVYVQSHALKQLQRRINPPDMLPYVESWMSESLREPNIVDRQGEDLLVEYKLQDQRLGYLVVTPLEDAVVVRTFLFLTMAGTPEALKLRQHLGLTRREIDWLRLDQLSAFTQTDLASDAELCEMLDQCGCGHLLKMEEVDCDPSSRGYATEIRRYLGMAA